MPFREFSWLLSSLFITSSEKIHNFLKIRSSISVKLLSDRKKTIVYETDLRSVIREFMTAKRQREIVVEFEMLKRVRKRAKTVLADCKQCGVSTDMVLIHDAATLFELETEELLRFAAQNGCHYQILVEGDIYLCVVSLLDRMKAKNQRLLA